MRTSASNGRRPSIFARLSCQLRTAVSGGWVSAVIRAANESPLMMIIGVLECSDSNVDKTEVPWEDRIKKLELRFPDLIVGDRD